MPLTEVYGMSETTGPHCCGTVRSNRLTSVGCVDQYNRSKIVLKQSDGAGELCIFGRHVFMGYLNNKDKTAEAFDNEGWLHTGDLGKIDSEGYLYITGRLKVNNICLYNYKYQRLMEHLGNNNNSWWRKCGSCAY